MSLLVKICGLKTPEAVECAVEAGADMVGFVFHPKSPRCIDGQTARHLASLVPKYVLKVALFADASMSDMDNYLDIVGADIIQLHGYAGGNPTRTSVLEERFTREWGWNETGCPETLDRVQYIREYLEFSILKAIGVAEAADLAAVPAYAAVADRILLDAKPPRDAAYPGGHGRPFDWRVLSALPPNLPFMLSGGLTPENVGEAIRAIRGMGLALAGVDVSSGVESAPGVKDLGKIRAFIAEVRNQDQREAKGV